MYSVLKTIRAAAFVQISALPARPLFNSMQKTYVSLRHEDGVVVVLNTWNSSDDIENYENTVSSYNPLTSLFNSQRLIFIRCLTMKFQLRRLYSVRHENIIMNSDIC
jgi:hypothetical protein